MSFAGLISGVMGGAAKGYSDYAELNMKKQAETDMQKELLKAREEMDLRIDEVKRGRDIADIGARSDAETSAYVKNAPLKARADADVAPIKAEGEAAAAPIKAGGEAKAQVVKTETPGYLKSVKSEATAKHVDSAASVAQADLARFELASKRAVTDLRTQLSKTTDPNERDNLTTQINDLSGNTTKSYGDMVTAAQNYRLLAQNLRKDAETVTDESERKSILDRAMYYEGESDSILQSAKGKRLGNTSSNSTPASVVRKDNPKPWEVKR